MSGKGVLLLSRSEIAGLLTIQDCIQAVEDAFRQYGEGKASPPGMLGVHVKNGGFHIKAGVLKLLRTYFAAKINGNFPQNSARFGLPTIQGAIVLCDAEDGRLLALMDSMEITAQRTAAATAVAAKYLARKNSQVVTICGCGEQGRFQLRALACILPLRTVYAYDADQQRAREFAEDLGRELNIEIAVAENLRSAVRLSDICVTCTTSREHLLGPEDVPPGMFIAAVGADNPVKQELSPALMAANKVVSDVTEQCAAIGDLHHAIVAQVMKAGDVHAELGEVVAGRKSGRTSPEEITIFDSTGMALQDVAGAALVYEKAVAERCYATFDFAA